MRLFTFFLGRAVRTAYASRLARLGCFLLLLAGLLPWAARAQAPAAGAAPSVGAALNPDGTVRRGQAGSFSAKGYRMTLDPATGGPVFRTTGAGDENWPDNFALNGANSSVQAVATAANGDVYIGGQFTTVGPVSANRVARWDGTAWNALGNGAAAPNATNNGVSSTVNALAISGTDVYVAGAFTSTYSTAGGTQLLNRVARWDGTAWNGLGNGTATATTTNNGVNGTLLALAISGTDVYVAGGFNSAYSTTGGTQLLNRVARWDGAAWTGLGNGAATASTTNNGVNNPVNALLISGSNLYVGGSFTGAYNATGSTQLLNRVARWDGTAWTGLGNGAATATASNNGVNNSVSALAGSGTTLYVGGTFTFAYSAAGTQVLNRVARWAGAAWTGLGNGAATASTTNNGVNNSVSALLVSGTEVYVGGAFTGAYSTAGGTQLLNYVARWDGAAWNGLGNGAAAATASNNGVSNTVNALGSSGGEVYAGGSFVSANSTAAGAVVANSVARWNGTTWNRLGATVQNGASNLVYAVATAANGDVYIGGGFSTVGPVLANRVARWDGTAWSALGNGAAPATATNNGVTGTVNAVAISGSNVYVGGTFTLAYSTAAGPQALNRVARWDGTAWSALGNGAATATASNNGVNNPVNALLISGTDVYVGGTFTFAYSAADGTRSLNRVARWDGAAWTGLGNGAAAPSGTNNGVNGPVSALAISGSDLYVGGTFTNAFGTAGTLALNYVARWDGAAWNGLGSGAAAPTSTNNGVNGTVSALAISGTDVYMAGGFNSAYSTASPSALNYVARWDGAVWNGLGNGAAAPTGTNNGTDNVILALAVRGTEVYVGGAFTTVYSTAGGAQALSNVARWNGTAWTGLGTGLNGAVRALVWVGSWLAVGGSFAAVGDGSKVLANFGFYTVLQPTLTAVAPSPGGLGQAITLTGTLLSSPTALTINGANALANILSNTGTSLVVRVPVTAAATGNVVISNAAGTASLAFTVMAPPGNALAFDGVDDYLSLGSTPAAANLGPAGITLEAWVYFDGNTGVNSIIRKTGDYNLYLNGGKLSAEVWPVGAGNPSWTVLNGSVLLPANRWTHVAATRNPTGSAFLLYVNGVPDAGATVGTGSVGNSENLNVGRSSIYGQYFKGRLDEVRIYSTALTAAQVRADMTSTAAAVPASLALYYNMDQGTPAPASTGDNTGLTTLYDLSPNATPATLTGFALASGNTASNYVPSYALVVPVVITSTARTATGFTVNWAAPPLGTATSYLLDVSTTPDFAAPIAGSPFATTATSYTLTGLSSASAYYYRVRALNSTLAQPDQGAYSNTVSQTSPLPVELTAFTATAQGNTAVRLAWATASEKNSAVFEVERSADGRTFAPIGTVAAAGSSSAARRYELTDAKLPAGAAVLYYRLKQVDLDGTFSYSPVRTVALTHLLNYAFTVFPNPTQGGTATLAGTAPGTVVTVFDALGRPVTTATADAAGTAALALPAGLPAGVYVVRAGSQVLRLTVE